MALLTIQRDPRTLLESGSSGQDEEENVKTIKSLSECYFAGKGSALMLGSNEHLRSPCDLGRLSVISTCSSSTSMSSGNTCPSTGQVASTGGAQATSSTTNSSDIHQHLQSMFYLLRPEETLKMAVKLESARAGRTRYLVVVSRFVKNRLQQTLSLPDCHQHHLSKLQNQQMVVRSATSSAVNRKVSPICSCTRQNHRQSNGGHVDEKGGGGDVRSKCCTIDGQKGVKCDNDVCLECTNDDYEDDDAAAKVCGRNYDQEESCLLGIDCNEKSTVGLVLRILADTSIRLDGDGGFSVSVCGRTHIFKPVSVQAMWSALQTLHKVSSKARENNYFAGGPSHEWVSYYEENIESDRSCLNEWHAMDSLESRRPPSPDTIRNKPTEREETERVIRTALKEIMMSVDLDEVTSKYIRGRLEEHLDMDLGEFKSFIDQEMLVILGQMDAPTEIFDHVYLGSEWNASNLEELQRNGVRHILNVTREIDNFFPGLFDYCNIRVYDDEKTDLLKHWDNTFKYISKAKKQGSKVLVHCKMGVSRSASVVIAYAMKAFNWDFDRALGHVRGKRTCIKPNKNFMAQLETYQGMLYAMRNKDKLQRSKSETNLKSTKDARLLPGSEPTPLIQALNGAMMGGNLLQVSGVDLKKIGSRPKSWSPNNAEATGAALAKPQSQSLENLGPPKVAKKPGNAGAMSKNVRLPCSNGQNYSVSQNQVVHLQEHNPNSQIFTESLVVPSVKSIVSELESTNSGIMKVVREKKALSLHLTATEAEKVMQMKKETWDPGEGGEKDAEGKHEGSCSVNQISSVNTEGTECAAEICDSPQDGQNLPVETTKCRVDDAPPARGDAPEVTKMAAKRDGDPFSSQLDRVFDREERKQVRHTTFPPTHATVVELSTNPEYIVSRNSSWSSVDSAVVMADGRDVPSRHSSWGSGDTRTLPSRNSSWGSYDIHVNAPATNAADGTQIVMGQSGIFPYDRDEIPWHPGTVKRTKQRIEEKTFVKRICSDENKSEEEVEKAIPQARSQSEEFLARKCSFQLVQLSASAPAGTTTSSQLEEPAKQRNLANRTLKYRHSMDETTDKKPTRYHTLKEGEECSGLSGMVQSLKMNFEKKATSADEVATAKKGRSLPSSPIAIHIGVQDKSSRMNQGTTPEDTNVRGLVDKYEVAKMRAKPPPNHTRQRPKSVLEVKSFHTPGLHPTKPLLINHSKMTKSLHCRTDEYARPPVPPPTVRNAILLPKALSKKSQQQQHGKTHPLTKLAVGKAYSNTAAPYNTM
ncbi:protein phosphatase Slingshot isoform X2 [Lutzomyia longipalpis]|uniref:protein phosphatase Slingshot isoform X2 n=1 Tax=Lutzomyia longipalpis TaxID=7200 RepID=UPI002483569A|nr:protein phosphatase Slingshot isoform X2 [Lutzomyia longipalpis]